MKGFLIFVVVFNYTLAVGGAYYMASRATFQRIRAEKAEEDANYYKDALILEVRAEHAEEPVLYCEKALFGCIDELANCREERDVIRADRDSLCLCVREVCP